MRTVTQAGLAALSLTTGLALTACGSSSSASSSQPATTPATSAAAASAPAASSSSGTGASPGSGAGSSGTPNCQSSDLKMTIGISDPSEHIIPLNLQNTSSQSCEMAGFPGVNAIGLVGGSTAQKTFSVARNGTGYSKITIAPGQYAQFTLAFKPTTVPALMFAPSSLVMTPPDTYSSIVFPLSSFDGTKLTFTLSKQGGLDSSAENVSPITTGPGDPQPAS